MIYFLIYYRQGCRLTVTTLLLGLFFSVTPAASWAAATGISGDEEVFADFTDEDEWQDNTIVHVADPLEPVNRVFFVFNDKLYFWLIKPVATGYAVVVPEAARECVSNFFYNLKMPVRLVNNLLQGKFSRSGDELSRFLVNSTVGVVGLWDPAKSWLDISASEEDLGQTLGKYGVGEGIYICWPFLGPSNIRDSLGTAGDYMLDPVSYLSLNGEKATREWSMGVSGGRRVNSTSLRLGDYEAFKRASFDPYSAMRDAYIQKRSSAIKDNSEN